VQLLTVLPIQFETRLRVSDTPAVTYAGVSVSWLVNNQRQLLLLHTAAVTAITTGMLLPLLL
jgi:hypothetical protein